MWNSKRGRGTSRSFNLSAPSTPLPPDRDILEGLASESLKAVSAPVPTAREKDAIKIKDVEYIGSYNWTKSATPTIIVPGSPPEWLDRPMPYSVPADVGIFFADQNGFRIPSSVLLPLVRAVDKRTEDEDLPSFDWSAVDFVTDRNGLRKLLRWIDNEPDMRDFRIDLQLAGKGTVLMNRWEKRTREMFSGYTFGFNFEKASTRDAKGCTDSTGHHRIVRYDFGGLKMVVRFEVDACIPEPTTQSTSKKITSAHEDVDSLADALSGVKIAASQPVAAPSSTLTIINGGSYHVAQSSVVELTTRSEKRVADYDWNEAFPQLYLSQTGQHILAVHQRGRFISAQRRVLGSGDLLLLEEDMQVRFRQLRQVLETVKRITVAGGERGRLSLVCRNGVLEVFERVSSASCLPDDILERFRG